jgi:hypothetical protein
VISGEDIEAWREDEKQTEFLAREKRRADNHVWTIQILDSQKGWRNLFTTFTAKSKALEALLVWKRMWPSVEFRVYEIVKEKL